MAYKVSFRSSFQRDFKKLSLPLQNFILDTADRIQSGELECEFDDIEHTEKGLQIKPAITRNFHFIQSNPV